MRGAAEERRDDAGEFSDALFFCLNDRGWCGHFTPMHHPFRTAFTLLGFLSATTSIAGCSDDPASDDTDIPERFRAFAAQFEHERQALEIPGAAVAIIENGRLAFAHGFGTKGVDSSELVGAQTLFRVGSLSKIVTALGVMSAVDDGLLDLDAPIRDAIPDLSLDGAESERLTLRQLLSQQSGLSDFGALSGPADDAALAAFTSGPGLAENVHFSNPPGLFWNYSNPNYYVAGRALEAKADMPYREAIRERVFAPLGMDRSFFLPGEVIADGDYSDGYGAAGLESDTVTLEDLPPDAYDNGWVRPAGFGFSNVLDWARLMQLLISGNERVISAGARDEVVSSQISTHAIYSDLKATALGLADDYGFGVGVGSGFFMDRSAEPQTYYAMPFLGHGGDVNGFASTFAVFPSTGFGIVVLSNRDVERPVDSIRLAMESFGGLPAPSAPPAGHGEDPSRFSRYAGTYRDRNGMSLDVAFEAGVVSVSGSLLDAVGLPYEAELEPTSLDNFSLWLTYQGERVPLEVTFLDDGTGAFTWFRSRIAVAQRAPVTEPAD